jgi:hypothetical protein
MFDRIRRIGPRPTAVGRGVAASLLTLAVLALVAVPAVSAAEPTPSAERLGRHPILRGTVRADLTVVKRDGTTVVVHYERGEITAVSATSITIKGRDGKGASFVVTQDTRLREKGKPATISDLEVGDRAMVFGTSKDGTYTAFLIRCIQPPVGAPASAPATAPATSPTT